MPTFSPMTPTLPAVQRGGWAAAAAIVAAVRGPESRPSRRKSIARTISMRAPGSAATQETDPPDASSHREYQPRSRAIRWAWRLSVRGMAIGYTVLFGCKQARSYEVEAAVGATRRNQECRAHSYDGRTTGGVGIPGRALRRPEDLHISDVARSDARLVLLRGEGFPRSAAPRNVRAA